MPLWMKRLITQTKDNQIINTYFLKCQFSLKLQGQIQTKLEFNDLSAPLKRSLNCFVIFRLNLASQWRNKKVSIT